MPKNDSRDSTSMTVSLPVSDEIRLILTAQLHQIETFRRVFLRVNRSVSFKPLELSPWQ